MATSKSDKPAAPEPEFTEETLKNDQMGDLAERRAGDVDESPNNVVRYVGVVTERHLTKADWEAAGVTDQGTVVWTRDTGHVLPIESFSDAALNVLRGQSEFAVVQRPD